MARISSSGDGIELGIYGIVLLGVGILALFVGCTDHKAARHALESEGYTEIREDGWGGPWVCDKWNASDFVAKNPAGKTVNGTVCSGLIFKNATITW